MPTGPQLPVARYRIMTQANSTCNNMHPVLGERTYSSNVPTTGQPRSLSSRDCGVGGKSSPGPPRLPLLPSRGALPASFRGYVSDFPEPGFEPARPCWS